METETRAGAPQFLLAGDGTDLPKLARILTRLPADAYGQVFIEVPSSITMHPFRAPRDVTITWLRRDDAAAGSMASRGELIVRAVSAWFDEWMTDGGSVGPMVIWIGCSASPRVARLHRDLRRRYPQLGEHTTASAFARKRRGEDDRGE